MNADLLFVCDVRRPLQSALSNVEKKLTEAQRVGIGLLERPAQIKPTGSAFDA